MGKKEINSTVQRGFKFIKLDIVNQIELNQLFEEKGFSVVFNLAAQAGVRYSIEQPKAYVDSNLVGFANVLECCRNHGEPHLIYASSSSVYGNSCNIPFSTNQKVDTPISFYAATKKSNELMAYSYSHLFNIPMTGVRFFTVYGEWGRPDMATMLFANSILGRKEIKVFNEGNLSRDFTYVGDIIEGLVRIMNRFKIMRIEMENCDMDARYKLYNIGSGKPIKLLEFITILEEALGQKAIKKMYPMQPGDVSTTYADVSNLVQDVDYKPSTDFEEGIYQFAEWYKGYFSTKS